MSKKWKGRRSTARPEPMPSPHAAKPVPAPILPAVGRVRYVMTGELELLSPLHLGTGDFRQFKELALDVKKSEAESASPDVAAILRNDKDEPFLSGTSIKGLLRRIGEAILPAERCARLFGEIGSEGRGRRGVVLVRGSEQVRAADATGMPYRALGGERLGAGVFIAARTRIDGASGTAQNNALFFQEMVAAGAHFALSLTIDCRTSTCSDDEQGSILADLAGVLGRLSDAEGWAIGRGQADGQGRIRRD